MNYLPHEHNPDEALSPECNEEWDRFDSLLINKCSRIANTLDTDPLMSLAYNLYLWKEASEPACLKFKNALTAVAQILVARISSLRFPKEVNPVLSEMEENVHEIDLELSEPEFFNHPDLVAKNNIIDLKMLKLAFKRAFPSVPQAFSQYFLAALCSLFYEHDVPPPTRLMMMLDPLLRQELSSMRIESLELTDEIISTEIMDAVEKALRSKIESEGVKEGRLIDRIANVRAEKVADAWNMAKANELHELEEFLKAYPDPRQFLDATLK